MTRQDRFFNCRSARIRAFARTQLLTVLLICLARWGQAQTAVDIHAIAVDLPASPYLYSTYGSNVTTTGIVIAVLSDGFYIENPSSDFDSNTCSSEGIYVYTGAGNVPSNAVSGYSVKVTGAVMPSNSSSYAGVQINVATPVASNVVTQSTGNSLPSAISSSVMTAATSGTCPSYPSGTFGQWLPFEGMRVNVPSSSYLLVAEGTGGTVNSATQTATTDGRFWAVFTDTASTSSRPVRATGISELDTVPSTAPSTVQRWAGNPQLLLVDTVALGGTALDASAETLYSGTTSLTGIVDYHVSAEGYTGLLLTSDSVSALSKQSGATPVAASTRGADDITFATQNLESSPGVGLAETETSRITKLAAAIVNYEKAPDIVSVQNATPAALNLLASAISSISGPAYTVLSGTTNLSDGLVDGFLVNTNKFNGTPTVASALGAATYTTASSTTALLFDRVPLVLTAKIPRLGISDFPVTVVNASLLPRTNIDDSSLGADVRLRREQQAEQLATLVLEPLESAGRHALVTGGFDSFEFSDGYVDSLGILDGSEANNTSTGSLVTLYDSTYNTTTLENTTTTATNLAAGTQNPTTSRYTYVESGSAEQTDHILITPEMGSLVAIDYARFGADFPVSETYDTSAADLPNRAASHDGVIAYLTVPYPTTTVVTTSGSPSYYDADVTFTATVTVTDSTVTNHPDGTVLFKDTDGTTLGTGTLSGGVATFTISTLSVGTHTITASYGGSESGLGYQASSGTVQQIVVKDVSSLTLGSSPNPSYFGDPVTFTATASSSGNVPTGTVTFYEGATPLGTGTVSAGIATMSISTLSVGTHVIQASYGGDTTNDTTASNNVSQVVLTVYTPTSTLSCSPNPAQYGATVTCTDVVAGSVGTPSGTVTFYDGTTPLGTAALASGTATYTTSSLAVGSHSLTAVLPRNDPYVASTSNVFTEIIASTFTLSATPASAAVYTGEAADYTVTVVPGTGFTLDVALACSGLPANTSCTLTPSTVSGGSGTAKLVIQTTAPAQATTAAYRAGRHAWPLLAGVLLLIVPKRFRKSYWLMGLMLTTALAAATLSACGGSGSLSGGTPAGSYTVTVSGAATDGSLTITGSTDVTLKVKSLF